MERKHRCPHCERKYAMLWAYENHIKVCPFKFKKDDGKKKK